MARARPAPPPEIAPDAPPGWPSPPRETPPEPAQAQTSVAVSPKPQSADAAGALALDPAAWALLGALAVFAALAALFAFLAWRRAASSSSALGRDFEALAGEVRHTDRVLRDEMARTRGEADARGILLRTELREQVTGLGASLMLGQEGTRGVVETRMDAFARTQSDASEALRLAVGRSVTTFGESLKADIAALTDGLARSQAAFQATTREALGGVEQRVAALSDANEHRQAQLRETVEARLEALRAGNEARLEQMRATVEEKLQGTLEKRLGESFALVSERLENVHRGLGEMQSLATGVGDLKKVLANVKDRGGWAEIQLGMMLENMLAREQFEMNVAVDPSSSERVEYAVRLPGQDSENEVLLPIDAKFPKEDYERLVDAMQAGDAAAIRAAHGDLARVVEGEAKKIASKYIRPPRTTDFAIMYLPTEGLFAEVMRHPGLATRLQGQHRVTVAGPTTLSALLNSLQMGFRTLAIQKRSGEVWRVLGEAKTEFEKYGDVWDKLKKQLETAQNTVEAAGRRSRAVARRLRDVAAVETGPDALPEPADDDL